MFRTLALVFILTLATVSAGASERLPGPIPAAVLRVVDGDTVEVAAHIWLGQEVRIAVRLVGIDTPELRGACAREKQMAQDARRLLAAAAEATPITLHDVETDKYGGRVRADLRDAQGVSLADRLVAAGLARAYDGGRRGSWCG